MKTSIQCGMMYEPRNIGIIKYCDQQSIFRIIKPHDRSIKKGPDSKQTKHGSMIKPNHPHPSLKSLWL